MDAVEKENPSLKGVLPKDYARPAVDKRRLGELVDIVGTIGLGAAEHREKDLLGRTYEYFIGRFASQEGKGGGEFYTPHSVVKLLVEMLEPYEGRVYDPCCGSGGMFVQSTKFVEAHGGQRNALAIYGQENVSTTWKLAKMNLAIRGIEANLGDEPADSFHNDKHPDLKADFVLANPPFNISDWGGDQLREDKRWRYGTPPAGNANFAWLQHILHHLAPNGRAGVVLANGSVSTKTTGEGDIRQALIEADLVDCMVVLPTQLFFSTPVPVCLWFLAKNRKAHDKRNGEVLFIDARALGHMASRVHRVLDDDDVTMIAKTYHAWRGSSGDAYEDVPGFCSSTSIDEIVDHDFVLTPGRYVGAADSDDDSEPLDVAIARMQTQLSDDIRFAHHLDEKVQTAIKTVLDEMATK